MVTANRGNPIITIIALMVSLLFMGSCTKPTEPEMDIPSIQWVRTYGTEHRDVGRDVKESYRGGYIIVGGTYCGDFMCEPDVYIIKTSIFGDIVWEKTYGGESYERATAVQEVPGGGYIITGMFSSYNSFEDIYLLRIDENGDSLWTKIFTYSQGEIANSILCTDDGGYVIAGYCTDHIYSTGAFLMKTDSNGDELWLKNYREGSYVFSLAKTSDAGYIMGGSLEGDGYLIKTDSNGDTLWTSRIDCSAKDTIRSVCETSDGGYIATGEVFSDSNWQDILVSKVDESGNVLWKKVFGGKMWDVGISLFEDRRGGYIVVGNTTFRNDFDDVYVLKIDMDGTKLWSRIYGGNRACSAGTEDEVFCAQQVSDGGYIITGETSYYASVFLMKIR